MTDIRRIVLSTRATVWVHELEALASTRVHVGDKGYDAHISRIGFLRARIIKELTTTARRRRKARKDIL